MSYFERHDLVIASALNHTSIALAASATWTGTHEADLRPGVGVSCESDTDGTLFFDFTDDGGANWSALPANGFAVAAGVHEIRVAMKLGRMFRARFVNGPVQQTYFRLSTYFGQFAKETAALSNEEISYDSDALLVRPSSEFGRDVTLNRISGCYTLAKFGFNSDVDANVSEEDVWGGGGLYTGFPSGAPGTVSETVEVFSDSVADDSAGTGVRTLKIFGLDENGDDAEETLTMDGTTPVTSSTSFYRVNRAFGVSAGSGGTNAGNVTCRHSTTTANVFFALVAGQGQTEVAAYTVPAGKEAILTRRAIGASNQQGPVQEIQSVLAHRPYENTSWRYRQRMVVSTGQESQDLMEFGIRLGPLDDIAERVIDASGGNVSVTARLDLIVFELAASA